MDKLDIILWVISGGFTLMLVMWHTLNTRMDSLNTRMDLFDTKIETQNTTLSSKIDKLEDKLSFAIEDVEDTLSNKIDRLDEKLTDVDRRICRLEGAFASKDCCMIKDDRQMKKAE